MTVPASKDLMRSKNLLTLFMCVCSLACLNAANVTYYVHFWTEKVSSRINDRLVCCQLCQNNGSCVHQQHVLPCYRSACSSIFLHGVVAYPKHLHIIHRDVLLLFKPLLLRTYLLTPWSTVLLEKLTGSAASQEIPRIFGTRRFITVFTSSRHLSLA